MRQVRPSIVYRLFYPAVPAIVACSEGHSVYAMPVVSLIPLSNRPPLVGISSAREHSTHKALVRAGTFSVSWVDASLSQAIERLGTTPHSAPDKLLSVGLKHTKGTRLGVPIVTGCVASLECTLSARQPLGDHELLVGKVEEARATADFREYWRFANYEPVLYAGIQQGEFTTYRPGPTRSIGD